MSGDMLQAPSRVRIGPAFKPCGWAGSVALAGNQMHSVWEAPTFYSIFLILRMRGMRPGEGQKVAQGHTVISGESMRSERPLGVSLGQLSSWERLGAEFQPSTCPAFSMQPVSLGCREMEAALTPPGLCELTV